MTVSITDMIGKNFTKVKAYNNSELVFKNTEELYRFYHNQDCCETVSIEEIIGDLSDLVDTPILEAREDSNLIYGSGSEREEQWTFYNFRTIKGSVTVRWYGESNGYYSTSVSLVHYKL